LKHFFLAAGVKVVRDFEIAVEVIITSLSAFQTLCCIVNAVNLISNDANSAQITADKSARHSDMTTGGTTIGGTTTAAAGESHQDRKLVSVTVVGSVQVEPSCSSMGFSVQPRLQIRIRNNV